MFLTKVHHCQLDPHPKTDGPGQVDHVILEIKLQSNKSWEFSVGHRVVSFSLPWLKSDRFG